MVSTHRWADLGTEADRAERDRFVQHALGRWQRLLDLDRSGGRLAFGPGLWVEREGSTWVVRWEDPSLRPWAESVARAAPPGQAVVLGLPRLGWESALRWVEHAHGVDLSSCQVRVGITRGHLLALVFSVPLDVPADADRLELAAEALCERALGEDVLDRWVVGIDVVRSARRSKLAVLSSEVAAAETHPLPWLERLVDLGIEAVRAGLPESRFGSEADGWTALELEPGTTGPQAERTQAFTNVPEALKAALEGLPFDSARFTKGPEVMIWLGWTARGLPQRLAARQRGEGSIARLAERKLCALCGSGFGPKRDYLDLWALPEPDALAAIRAELASSLGTAVELGFYDSNWSRERLSPWQAEAPTQVD